jgi:eukaryotic-like serine/threonine-protein kinase
VKTSPQKFTCRARSEAHWTALILHCGWELFPCWEDSGRSPPAAPAWEASYAGRLEYVEKTFERVFAEKEYTVAAELASCLGEAGREDRAIELLETTIAAAEASEAVPAADLLDMREMLAWHSGEKFGGHGDPQRAAEIARRLVRDSTTVHGADHRETLAARTRLARQVGAAGNPRQALTMAREADAAATAALGVDDRTTLSVRFEVAIWTAEVDGAAAGAERFTELIQQAERLDPPPRSLIADSMVNLASYFSDVATTPRRSRSARMLSASASRNGAQRMPASCGCG